MSTGIRERLERALTAYEPGAQVVEVLPMHGGLSATTHAFVYRSPSADLRKMVARQPAAWRFRDNSAAASTEFHTLHALARTVSGVPIPRFLDVATESDPQPFFFIDFVDGEVQAQPSDVNAYVRDIAATLATIHESNLDEIRCSPIPKSDPWKLPQSPVTRPDLDEARVRQVWEDYSRTISPTQAMLCHGDYWPGNILWQGQDLVSVIDWEHAYLGDGLADLATCRLEILWMCGSDAMERFTNEYARASDRNLEALPHWDMRACIKPIMYLDFYAKSYDQLGRSDVNVTSMAAGLRSHIAATLKSIR